MPEDHRGLAGLLHRHGAVELADVVWSGSALPGNAFHRLRVELNGAARAAADAGETPALTTALRASIDAGDDVGRSLLALLQGDPTALPAGTPAGAGVAVGGPAPAGTPAGAGGVAVGEPAPTPAGAPAGAGVAVGEPAPMPAGAPAGAGVAVGGPAPMPAVPSTPAGVDPFAVRLPAHPDPPPGASTLAVVSDGFAWAAVAVSVAGVAAALLLPVHLTVVGGPIAYAAVVALLLADRQGLAAATRDRPPGWGWAALPPAYLFRRGRALGRWPVHGYALVALGFLFRAGVHLFGLGSDDLVDLRPFETQLAERFSEEWGRLASAECPRRVSSERDTAFVCVVEAVDGTTRAEYGFRIVDDRGRVELTSSSLSTRATG
jgi:hypothetical protein